MTDEFEQALAEMIHKSQCCVIEPWVVAAQWKDELVKLAKECKAMQEHPKDCMYSKDNYTDEDRKILCEGCEEDCKYNKKEEPVSEVWHNASKEPNDMSHCLIYYGCKESVGHYLHYESVLYNKKEKVFVTPSFPHPTWYKVEQKSIDGGCVAEVYKNRRDRISISDITQWCYLYDLHNISNIEKTENSEKEEPVSEIDFEQELYKAFGQVKDFTLGMRIAKWFYDMGKNSQEPVKYWNKK